MSDSMRKGLGEQATEKLQPDSTKSTTDKASENISGAGDRIAGALQPEDHKSAGQKLGDATRSGHDDASNKSSGIMQSAQDSLSNAGQAISDTLSGGQKK